MTVIRGKNVGVLPTVDEMIEAHNGNIREAEAEAWEAWAYDGKKEHSAYKFLAIGISERKWVGGRECKDVDLAGRI
jgi:hypothetical protein